MLTENQEQYLLTIPGAARVAVVPYDPALSRTSQQIIHEIHREAPELPLLFLGAAALELPGLGDIDLYALSAPAEFSRWAPEVERVLGPPTSKGTSIAWDVVWNGYHVDLSLTDPASPSFQEQVTLFEILRQNTDLRREYGRIKVGAHDQSLREYQRRKYVFYNRVLGLVHRPA